VWTGREVIVVGGLVIDQYQALADGAAFDPASGAWRRIAVRPSSGRVLHAVWTGTEVLVWGGQAQGSPTAFGDEFSDGALYDPVKNTWKPMAPWPLAPRYGARAVWTGTRLVVWGGASAEAGDNPPPLGDGAAYDPGSDHWTTLPAAPVAGRIARAGSGVYNLTKFGVGAFSEALRQETAPRGIRVTLHSLLRNRRGTERAMARRVRAGHPDAFVFTGVTVNGCPQIVRAVHRLLPRIPLITSDGCAESDFTRRLDRGTARREAEGFVVAVLMKNGEPAGSKRAGDVVDQFFG